MSASATTAPRKPEGVNIYIDGKLAKNKVEQNSLRRHHRDRHAVQGRQPLPRWQLQRRGRRHPPLRSASSRPRRSPAWAASRSPRSSRPPGDKRTPEQNSGAVELLPQHRRQDLPVAGGRGRQAGGSREVDARPAQDDIDGHAGQHQEPAHDVRVGSRGHYECSGRGSRLLSRRVSRLPCPALPEDAPAKPAWPGALARGPARPSADRARGREPPTGTCSSATGLVRTIWGFRHPRGNRRAIPQLLDWLAVDFQQERMGHQTHHQARW